MSGIREISQGTCLHRIQELDVRYATSHRQSGQIVLHCYHYEQFANFSHPTSGVLRTLTVLLAASHASSSLVETALERKSVLSGAC